MISIYKNIVCVKKILKIWKPQFIKEKAVVQNW